MRRTPAAAVAAASAFALGGGLLVALPTGVASAAAAPKLLSVSASPKAYVSLPRYDAYNSVTVTAVFYDPNDVIEKVNFQNAGLDGPSPYLNYDDDVTSVVAGSNRTFSFTFRQNFSSVEAGVNRVYVVGLTGYTDRVPGTSGSASFVIKNKPQLQFRPTTGLSIWGTKAGFYGTLSATSDAANKKVRIEFDRKGKQKGKKWKKRQVVRTNADGYFSTKKFKINKVGRLRARFTGTTYVLPVKEVWKIKRYR